MMRVALGIVLAFLALPAVPDAQSATKLREHELKLPIGGTPGQRIGASIDVAHAWNPGRIFSSLTRTSSDVSVSFARLGNASFTLRRKSSPSVRNTANTRSENRF